MPTYHLFSLLIKQCCPLTSYHSHQYLEFAQFNLKVKFLSQDMRLHLLRIFFLYGQPTYVVDRTEEVEEDW